MCDFPYYKNNNTCILYSKYNQQSYDSIKIEAEFMWLQLGVINQEGIKIATKKGINCIVDLCIKIEHARYTGNSN